MKKTANILFVAAMAFAVVVNIVLLALSFEVYDDGYGTSYSCNENYIASLIIFIALLVFAVMNFLGNGNAKVGFGTLLVVSGTLAFFPLGKFFKAMSKGEAYTDNQTMLYIGIVGLLLFAYSAIHLILISKKEN